MSLLSPSVRASLLAASLLTPSLAACVRRPEEAPPEPPRVIVVRPPQPPTAPPDSARVPPIAAVPGPLDSACVAPPRPATPPVPPLPMREFRAAWVTPIGDATHSDWPSRPGLGAEQQQAELRALLDRAERIGLNAIILHVRTAADALYPTPLAPWSAFLSGRSGVPPRPAYDPLAFAIAEAHARGLQLHAWFNPFRAILPNIAASAAATHVTRTHPQWIRRYGRQRWIDPGEPAARAWVLDAIVDVVKRYDVDGVHIDDYFYPYLENETIVRRVRKGKKRRRVTVRHTRVIAFPDDATFKRYGRPAGFASRADWRRANIDDFVRRLYGEVKAAKPWVLVGVSPFGIWRSGTPRGVTGLDAYAEIFGDSRRWLREGWLDYLVPQLYWPLAGAQRRWQRLDEWWLTQNPHGRYVWPGVNAVAEADEDEEWPRGEIASQVDASRRNRASSGAIPGAVHFRLGALVAEGGAVGETLRTGPYAALALAPELPRRDVARDTTTTWWLVRRRVRGGTWTATLRPASAGAPGAEVTSDAEAVAVAVTPIDRWGHAGETAAWWVGGVPVPPGCQKH